MGCRDWLKTGHMIRSLEFLLDNTAAYPFKHGSTISPMSNSNWVILNWMHWYFTTLAQSDNFYNCQHAGLGSIGNHW